MIIHVKGFGKIKSADINIGNLTLFIGENNSGKTYLMQLIYQILDSITGLIDLNGFLGDEEDITYINSSNWRQINDILNRWLYENKSNIIKKAFLYSFPIEELSIDLDEINGEYLIEKDFDFSEERDIVESYVITCNGIKITKHKYTKHVTVLNRSSVFVSDVIRYAVKSLNIHYQSLFIPASRSGLMLVYRNVIASQSRYLFADPTDKIEKNNLGLTKPVYDFLDFLQTYRFRSGNNQQKKIVDFISNNIIDGTFDIDNNAILYKPNSSNQYFPAHLSSSMVNEIAPIVMMLTNLSDYNLIFYDEIETCLHPLKQIEMARLTARLVNNGYKLIISTHSDTMAIALNNLIMLSQLEDRNAKAEKLGYNEDDFFKKDNIHVYQFKCAGDETIVSEIEMYPGINIGYNFELFNMSNDKLYDDAKTIMGDHDE